MLQVLARWALLWQFLVVGVMVFGEENLYTSGSGGGALKPQTTAAKTFEEYSERIYQREKRKRWRRIEMLYGKRDPDLVIPWDGEHAPYTYLWDYFAPSYNCPYRERLGSFSEGGKVVCNWEALRSRVKQHGAQAVTVISLGVRDDISFELALLARTHATIHAFDPSVSALPTGEEIHVEPQTPRGKERGGPGQGGVGGGGGGGAGSGGSSGGGGGGGGSIVFQRKGLKGNSLNFEQGLWGPLETLDGLVAGVMQANNNNVSGGGGGSLQEQQQQEQQQHGDGGSGGGRIDFLKIDCEGCEWEAFKYLNESSSNVLHLVDQLTIELHFSQHKTNAQGPSSGVREVFEFFEVVEGAGLRAFSWEVNHNPSGYWGEKPWAVEYSFVRPTSDYITQPPF